MLGSAGRYTYYEREGRLQSAERAVPTHTNVSFDTKLQA